MTKQEFRQLTHQKFLFLDGATGSNLQKCGMPTGVCPEKWITENREVLIQLQREYRKAGSQVVYAPTFSANRVKLREYGMEDSIRELNHTLVVISREAAGKDGLVAGDITMTGEQLSPIGTMDFETLVDIYKEQISYLAEAGVDLLVVETMMSLQETRAALIAAKETVPTMPVIVTMTFESDGRTLFGTDARTAAVVLENLGADAIGANCSTGPAKMAEVIRSMADVTEIPIIAKPNAGLPSLDENGHTVYDMNPEEFAEEIKLLVEAGASILGGCCGTTPDHIRRLKETVQTQKPVQRQKSSKRFLTSERKTVAFGLNDPFLIVGERINPTGKKKLQEELRNGSLDMVLQFAEEQEEKGASILDVNLGMNGIDEKQMMLQALEEISGVTSLPLSIDSSHIDVLEAALRRYPGRALINSISCEKEKFEKLIPIAKKYGAMFILLPLSDEGLPGNLQEKKEIIDKIMQRAFECGLTKEDIVVDGLVTTVGANPNAALEALETIRYCKQLGLATTCGLSNISFGLPERGQVNTAFLTMAIQSGLTMAIANPSQELLVSAAFASDLLLKKENSDIRYIGYSNSIKEKREGNLKLSEPAKKEEAKKEENTVSDEKTQSALKVREAVLKGNRKGIEELTKEALHCGNTARELLDDQLLSAINEVGELFDKDIYFLPQLIASAESMKLAIGILEPLLKQGDGQKDMPVVVIATVEGDIHDIGKNLVALMLKNYGFQVIDLGKDVSKEKIVETALDHKAEIIALSALMTTTMQQMRNVVSYAKERNCRAKIMIGGAVITQEYADEIGADGYSADAAEAVKLAQRLTGRS